MPDFDQDEFRKDWIAALRSGEYEQGQRYLNRGGRFCCLGVACDLLEKRGLLKSELRSKDFYGYWIDDQIPMTAVLPRATVKLLGLRTDNGHDLDRNKSLTVMNDGGFSFDVIADALETGEYWV